MASPTRTLGFLSASGFLAWMSYEMIRSPVLALYAESLGAGPAQIGFIVAASTITGIFVKFPAGALSDHFPRKAILLFGMCVFGVVTPSIPRPAGLRVNGKCKEALGIHHWGASPQETS